MPHKTRTASRATPTADRVAANVRGWLARLLPADLEAATREMVDAGVPVWIERLTGGRNPAKANGAAIASNLCCHVASLQARIKPGAPAYWTHPLPRVRALLDHDDSGVKLGACLFLDEAGREGVDVVGWLARQSTDLACTLGDDERVTRVIRGVGAEILGVTFGREWAEIGLRAGLRVQANAVSIFSLVDSALRGPEHTRARLGLLLRHTGSRWMQTVLANGLEDAMKPELAPTPDAATFRKLIETVDRALNP